ncbi:SDR family NAD(P)-dependent oxidoreductase [Nakamurella sp. YIM 132087]|uniref:SDR family NAD(P)-dependent oxidoreductase n=1 Tax=Nakamurella alba TaxID=2665158 RepID=A0A7K1FGE9_9ACTN|nr:oxidoreductase [Nakamurella alba]MTD12373.1 SDR family NAD(P)-dependent oxidoreductase [Nakamurella alba]
MATWLITGSSSGLGRALAAEVLRRGHDVVAAARNPDLLADLAGNGPGRVLPVRMDVTDPDQVTAGVRQAEEEFGGVDVLVNNAGYGYRAALEEGDETQVADLFETHVFGAVRTIKAVLPGMRERRSGTIVNLSSIGARICLEGSGYYSAVKAALEALTSSLRKEVAPLGIEAMVIEPGAFRTDFAGRSLVESPIRIADYDGTAGKRRKVNDTSDGTQAGDPRRAAAVIADAVDKGGLPSLLLLGNDAADAFAASADALRAETAAWEAVTRSTDFR